MLQLKLLCYSGKGKFKSHIKYLTTSFVMPQLGMVQEPFVVTPNAMISYNDKMYHLILAAGSCKLRLQRLLSIYTVVKIAELYN